MATGLQYLPMPYPNRVPMNQPLAYPPAASFFHSPPPPLSVSSCFPSPPIPMQLSQQPAPQGQQPRRLDLGYESEDKESSFDANSTSQHLSRPGSACDSARPESPDAASVTEGGDASQLVSQVEKDLAGFRISGPRPVDMALSQQMEIVWHERFIDFFGRFPSGSWHLFPVFDPPDVENTGVPRNQWRYCKDQAKVRFICTSCQKAWTSMGGQVVFWIYKDDATNQGYVHFKLYGQKCADCDTPYYEHAIWYQEEVEKVIENLYHQVGHMYYGAQQRRKRVDRRMGHPKNEHNSSTCQACRDRVCRMGQLLKRKGRRGGRRCDSGAGAEMRQQQQL